MPGLYICFLRTDHERPLRSLVRRRKVVSMAKQGTCFRRWKALNKLRWVLWMCFVVEPWCCAECLTGCSFSADDWCGFSNVHDGINGPTWIRQKTPPQQPQNPYHGYGMTPQGTHPMQRPPKGDYYLYTGPTQNNRLTEKTADLSSPLLEVNDTSTCLYFSYHNRVPVKLVPTLVVLKRSQNVSDEFQETDEILAAFYSLNSDKWFEAAVRLPVGEYYLVFSGKNYNNRTLTGGQIGITNVAIGEGDCGGSVPDWLDSPGDCGFEGAVGLCGYRYSNDSTVRLMGILAESLPASEQALSGQRRPPADRFMAMNAQFHEISTQGSRARLLSPEISIQNEGCLIMWYYNSVQSKHDSNNAFNILKLEKNTEHLLFRLPIPRSNRDRWYQLNGALPRGTYHLVLEVVYTGDFAENDYVGFDSVEVFNRSCSDVKSAPNACDNRGPTGNPVCRNGGTCTGSGKRHFRCACAEGYYGTRCEHRYACSERDNPCRYGGTCVPDGKIDFRCTCRAGYDGRVCDDVRKCGSPEEVLKNAVLTSDANATAYGSTASFDCTAGYLKYGDLSATCNAEGTWVTGGGKCARVDCPQPPTFSGTILVYVTNTSLNGMAKYRCPEGMMTAKDRDFLVCRVTNYNQYYYYNGRYNGRYNPNYYPDSISGQWLNLDNSQHVGCYNIPRCPQPLQISNAEVNYTTLLMSGVATYQCNEGYEFAGNWTSFQLNCSQDGRWSYNNQVSGTWVDFEYMYAYSTQQFQCFRTADCGPPPKVPNSAVSYNDTRLNSQAVYSCREGYRLVDSEAAVCWKIAERSANRWLEWLFVPTCEFVCPVKEGRRGNLSVAVFRVHDCVLEGLDSYSAKLNCVGSMTYSVKRKNFNKELEISDDKTVFYGSDLCIAERQTRVKRFGEGAAVQRVTKCRSFCLQRESEIRDVVVLDELTSVPSKNQNRGPGTVGTVFETKRKRSITRYEVISFN